MAVPIMAAVGVKGLSKARTHSCGHYKSQVCVTSAVSVSQCLR